MIVEISDPTDLAGMTLASDQSRTAFLDWTLLA